MDQIDCHSIEQCLLGHDMVRDAACYKSPFGKLYVEIQQREPVLYVVSNDGSYFIDSDRKTMPLRRQIVTYIARSCESASCKRGVLRFCAMAECK